MTNTSPKTVINPKDISVVVQGAIDAKYTPLCLASIRKYLPGAEIILSTWQGSPTENLDYDKLILNEDPGGFVSDYNTGTQQFHWNNFNRQLVSSRNGVLQASRTYCLKFRTDFILRHVGFLDFWSQFPIRDTKYAISQHRMLASSVYSRELAPQGVSGLPTPFHPSDFWFFGLLPDVQDYFEHCPLQTEVEAAAWKAKYPNRVPFKTCAWRYTPEQFFCIHWLRHHQWNFSFEDWSDWNPVNTELSNHILYNNFIFLDVFQSGIDSHKHAKGLRSYRRTEGLISFNIFQRRYQRYCDNSYQLPFGGYRAYIEKDLKSVHKHAQRVFKGMSWIGEVFSLLGKILNLVYASLRYCLRRR